MDKEFVMRFLDEIFNNEPNIEFIYADDGSSYIDLLLNQAGAIITLEEGNYLFENHFYSVHWGATKIVFVFDDFDCVLKIGIDGEFEEDCLPSMEEMEEEDFEFYECVDIYDNNYMDLEDEIYSENDGDPQQEILLPNRYFCDYKGIPIYIQEKILETFSERYEDDYSVESAAFEECNEDLKQRVITSVERRPYGVAYPPEKKFLADIIEFYKEKGESIIESIDLADLHHNNYGYLKCGRPVIFDYAGFYD